MLAYQGRGPQFKIPVLQQRKKEEERREEGRKGKKEGKKYFSECKDGSA
jgi:hypothetical protein